MGVNRTSFTEGVQSLQKMAGTESAIGNMNMAGIAQAAAPKLEQNFTTQGWTQVLQGPAAGMS